MNYYLSKYVGTYRIKTEIDKRTNDFCRDENGNLENNQDIYIVCADNIRIYHYGGSTLQVYIPSIGKGRNVIRSLYINFINPKNSEEYETEIKGNLVKKRRIVDSDLYESEMAKQSLIFNMEETDSEVLFKFKDKDMDKIAFVVEPSTFGASISPFSSKNLPKRKGENGSKYSILSCNQIEEYKKISDRIPKEDKLKIKFINDEFIHDILQKKCKIDGNQIKTEMKKECIKTLDYIAFKGMWDEYINFLRRKVKELYGNN